MAFLKENDLYQLKGTGQRRKIKLDPVYIKFWEEHDFIKRGKPLTVLRSLVSGRMSVWMAGLSKHRDI
jgi:hypothetical protein